MHREGRHQGHAAVGAHHVAQGFQAGGAKAVALACTGHLADFQRLVAQAVAVVQ